MYRKELMKEIAKRQLLCTYNVKIELVGDMVTVTGITKDCSNGVLDIPYGVEKIDRLDSDEWFTDGHKDSVTKVNIPNTVSVLAPYCFAHMSNLVELVLPDSITDIGEGAFKGTGLSEIHIPKSVVTIGVNAFSEEKLKSITVAKDNPVYASRDGVLYSKDFKTLIQIPANKMTFDSELLDGVVVLGDYAFSYSKITSTIILPDTVKKVCERCFFRCEATEISIPDSVTELGKYVIAECDKLRHVYLDCNLLDLPNYTVYNCRNLLRLHLPDGLEYINSLSILDVPKLRDVNVPKNLKVCHSYNFVSTLGDITEDTRQLEETIHKKFKNHFDRIKEEYGRYGIETGFVD